MNDANHDTQQPPVTASESTGPQPARAVEAGTQSIPPRSPTDGEEHAVDERSIIVARLTAIPWIIGIAAVQYLVILIVWAAGPITTAWLAVLTAVGIVLLGAALALAYKWPELHHRHLRYRVDDGGLRIRRGVLWRKVISIPTSRVQHTDVSQGPLQRRYELATLTVYTAGTEGASISLAGLEQGAARRLRDHLIPEADA